MNQKTNISRVIVNKANIEIVGIDDDDFIGQFVYLLYVDGETTLSGGCLFTFGFTLLTCFIELFCAFGCCVAFNC